MSDYPASHGGFGSAAAQVFGLEHMRRAIFAEHYRDLLSRYREYQGKPLSKLRPVYEHPTELRDGVENFLQTLAPLLALHGFRSATVLDELQRRPALFAYTLEMSYQSLQRMPRDPSAPPPYPPSRTIEAGGNLADPLRYVHMLIPGLDVLYYGGMPSGRLLEPVVKIADATALPLLLHVLPSESQASDMWKRFFQRPSLMLDPDCPLLPATQLFEHGKQTYIVTQAPPRTPPFVQESTRSMRRRLENVRDAFVALAWLHKHQVSLNSFSTFDMMFDVSSYTQRAPANSGLAACPERFTFFDRLPEKPVTHFPHGPAAIIDPPGLPWAEPTANIDARVPGPRALLHYLNYASATDDCKTAHTFSHPPSPEHISPPEETALRQHAEWTSGAPKHIQKMPFCRFKRDVWLMARMLVEDRFMSLPSPLHGMEARSLDRLKTSIDSARYERVFSVDPNTFSARPYGLGLQDRTLWGYDTVKLEGDEELDDLMEAVPMPESLRLLFLDMLSEDPASRPSAEEAARRAQEIHDRQVPRIVQVYDSWCALQPPVELQPWPQTPEEEAAYVHTLRNECPAERLMLEHARGRYLNFKSRWVQGEGGGAPRLVDESR